MNDDDRKELTDLAQQLCVANTTALEAMQALVQMLQASTNLADKLIEVLKRG